ncbi:MAG: tetratricopeptide repeat protein [Phycisphaeraceae bacterium]
MAIRSKARRRLFLLLALVVLVVGAGAGFYTFRKQQQQQAVELKRVEGVTAFDEERYYDAMHALGTYVNQSPGDAEALYLYGQARMEVEEADGRSHLLAAAAAFRDVVAMDPENLEAKRKLLDLYAVFGYAPEALALADQILEAYPDDAEAWARRLGALVTSRRFEDVLKESDAVLSRGAEAPDELRVEAMRYRATALVSLERTDEAVTQAIELNMNAPEDFRGYLLTLESMKGAGRSRAEVLGWAKSVQEEHPEVEGTSLLVGLASTGPDLRQESLAWLQREADASPTDNLVIQMLVRELGRRGQLLATIELARVLQASSPSLQYEHLLLSHLLYAGENEEVVRLTDEMAENPDRASVRSLATRAQALFDLGRGDEAMAIVMMLEDRKSDNLALSYGAMLNLVYGGGSVEPMRLIQTAETATQRDPSNPMFYFWQGSALSAMGEGDRAIDSWRRATELAPSWDGPPLAIVRELMRAGRNLEAYGFAALLLQRSPNNLGVNINLLEAAGLVLDRVPERDRRGLLQLSEQVLEIVPGNERVLPVYLKLLVAEGRSDDAVGVMRSLIEPDAEVSDAALLAAAQVSADNGLGLEEELIGKAGTGRDAADVLVARAMMLHRDGDTEGAVGLMDAAVEAADGEQALLSVRMARAAVLERIGDARAGRAWSEVVGSSTDNVRVLQRALESRAIWSEREATRGAIDRLRDLTGRDGIGWRVAEARWLMTFGEREDLERARSMLEEITDESPTMIRPRLMLAEVFQGLGETELAITQLDRAKGLRGDDVRIDFARAELMRDVGRDADAARALETLAMNAEALSPEQVRQLARSLSELNRLPLAISMVQTLLESSGQPADRLLLAQLFERGGRFDEAAPVYEVLLSGPVDLQIVNSAARFYQSRGSSELAMAALEKLKDVPGLPDAVQFQIEGDYYRRSGDLAKARSLYERAAEADQTQAGAWQRLLAVVLTQGDREKSLEVLDGGLAANPGDQTLVFMGENRDLIEAQVEDAALRLLLVQMVERPDVRGASAGILRAAYEVDRDGGAADDLVARLQQVIREHPRYLPGQMILVQALAAMDRRDEALTAALQAVREFPENPEPAGLATDLLMSQGKWTEGRSMALQWRSRLADPLQADLRIAQAMIQMGAPNQAVSTLEPYMQAALATPEARSDVLTRWARARIAMGRADDARERLRPLLANEAWHDDWVVLSSAVSSREEGLAWMEDLEAVVDVNHDVSRLQLAIGWRTLGDRYDVAAYEQRARELLSTMTEGETAVQATLTLAMMDDTDGHDMEAEAGYRRVLSLQDNQPVALNNLAMILKLRGDTSEAVTMAERAVRVLPGVAAFRDTLALSLAADGRVEEGLEQAELSVALEPMNIEWQLTLAELLARADRVVEALDTVVAIDLALARGSRVSNEFRERLEGVREMLRSSASGESEVNAGTLVP